MKHLFKFLFVLFLYVQLPLIAQENSTNQAVKGLWDDYFQETLNAARPQYTLSLALQYFEKEGKKSGSAADLGTGTGRDALFLLKKEWKVLAIDAESLAIEILSGRANQENLKALDVMVSSYSEMALPDNLDLINASFSLPFCPPEDFAKCWENISDHLAIGGRFSGQFFGDKDGWAPDSSKTFLTQEQMLQLFNDHFEIEYLQIETGLVPTAEGPMKQWHVFHVVAKKIK